MKPLGQLLGTAWEIYTGQSAVFLGYTAWVLVPYALLILLEPSIQDTAWEIPIEWTLNVAQTALILWAVIAITILTWAILRKKKVKLELVGKKAWQLAPIFVVIQLVNGLIVVGGSLLLIIPGLVFWIWYAFSAQEVVLHKQHGLVALSQSRNLVRGRFWHVAWRLVGGHGFLALVYLFFTGALVGIVSLLTEGPSVLINPSDIPLWLEVLVNVIEIVFMPLVIAYSTVLYFDLRESAPKEPART
ncbi:hypothetical protein HYW18_01335 [Candidatus Uhrbacteria bacterium]|nr:hypothetical protein [Candidatus Uhrbacteria bacterium]